MGMIIDSSLSQNYLDNLDGKLNEAKTSLDCFAQAASKAKREYELTNQYYQDLKGYCTQVSTTYVHISDLYDYLLGLVKKAEQVGSVLQLSLESLGIIARMLKCLCEEVESLRAMIRDLLEAIDAIDSDVLKGEGATLVQCIRQLDEAVEKAVILLCEAISAVIILYRGVLELRHHVGGKDGSTFTGLVLELENMREILCCTYCAGINDSLPECDTKDLGEEVAGQLSTCCTTPCELSPSEGEERKIGVCDGGFDSDFFKNNIKDAMENSKLVVDYQKCVWQFYDRKRASVQAEHDAIKKSYDAAKAAKALCS